MILGALFLTINRQQNPLGFLLKAALAYPDKLAIAHPDVGHPVFYSFSVWKDYIIFVFLALI